MNSIILLFFFTALNPSHSREQERVKENNRNVWRMMEGDDLKSLYFSTPLHCVVINPLHLPPLLSLLLLLLFLLLLLVSLK